MLLPFTDPEIVLDAGCAALYVENLVPEGDWGLPDS